MMVRLTSSNLAGTTRTLVAVGTPREASMFATMRLPAPRSGMAGSGVSDAPGAEGEGAPVGTEDRFGAVGTAFASATGTAGRPAPVDSSAGAEPAGAEPPGREPATNSRQDSHTEV